MTSRKRAVFVLLSLGLALTGGLFPEVRARDAASLEDWAKGPIRYIITPDETRDYKRLRTDNERTAFIEKFWSRRDPSPKTYENEYRSLFWTRVRESNEKFRDSAAPGWRTDRGKIYILHGPPDEIQSDETIRSPSDTGSSEGLVRWVYVGRPGGRLDLDPVVVVPFVRSVSGEYKLSYDPKLSSVFLDWNALRDLSNNSGWARWADSLSPSAGSRMTAMLDLGRMQEIPGPEEVLLAQVDTYEFFESSPLPVDVHRFEPGPGPDSLVVLTFHLPPPAGDSESAFVARFTPRTPGLATRVASEAAFRVESARDGSRVAEVRFRLDPGTWDLLALAIDPDAGVSRAFRGSLAVPERRETLHTSDVVLAEVLEPLPYATMATYDAPFSLGAFRVRSRHGDEVPRGDAIRVFLEAYGGRAPYRAEFRLEGEEADGRWTALGEPASADEPLGTFAWSFPTSDRWPLGRYRVVVRVSDSGGSEARLEVPIRLVAP